MRHIILNLHGVGAPMRHREPGEDRYWIDERFFRNVLAVAQDFQHACMCTFTADDGNLSDVQIVAPALCGMGHTAVFFVLTSRMGSPGSLDRIALHDLQQMGHEIGSHGCSHVFWTGLDTAGLESEIVVPRRYLSEMTGCKIDKAALPFGRYNRKVLTSLRQAGFTQCYSSDGGEARDQDWPVHRTSLRADMTLEDVKRILLGYEPVTQRILRNVKGRLKKIF